MGQTNPVLGFLAKLQQSGLLPMLLQKAGMKPGAPGQQPRTAQASAPGIASAAGGGGQPGIGGSPPQASASPSTGGPQTKYNPSGAGAAVPPPIAQPHEAVQSIAGLLMNWNNRKKKGEEAEAANIAQNLIQAIRSNDKDTINDILNNDHSKKILNKVYKGWLTKMQEAQKPGKEQDPTVSGFESGIMKATQAPQGQPPGAAAGVRIPQPSQADQLGAAKTSAELQAAQQDPNRLLSSQLTSGEMRETQLGAGPEKVKAEREKASAAAQKAMSDLQKAQLEAQKAETELKIKQQEAATSKEKGELSYKTENAKYLKSLAELDIARTRLQSAIRGKTPPIQVKLKLAAIDKAIAIATKVQEEKRAFTSSDFGAMATELRASGATELVKKLPQNWLSTHFWASKDDVTDMIAALQHYKEGIQKGLEAEAPEKKAAAAAGGDEGPDDEEGDAEPQEGDEVEYNGAMYKFDGKQYVKQDKKP